MPKSVVKNTVNMSVSISPRDEDFWKLENYSKDA